MIVSSQRVIAHYFVSFGSTTGHAVIRDCTALRGLRLQGQGHKSLGVSFWFLYGLYDLSVFGLG